MKTKKIWPVNFYKNLPAVTFNIMLFALFALFFQGCKPDCDDCTPPPLPDGSPPTITSFKVEQGGQVISQTDSSADITVFRNDKLRVSYEMDTPNGYHRVTVKNNQYETFETTNVSFGDQNKTATIQLEYFDIHTGIPLVFEVSDRANKTTFFTINPTLESGINPGDVVDATWTKLNYSNTSNAIVITSCIAANNSLFGISNNILYRSEDGGNTWKRLDLPASACGLESLVLHPSGDLYGTLTFGDCGFFERAEIIKSSDNGNTWAILPTNLPEYRGRLQISNKGTLFLEAASYEITSQTGIWRSTNGGVSWSMHARYNNLNSSGAWRGADFIVVNDSTTLVRLYVGFMDDRTNLFRSTDDGKTWQVLPEEKSYGKLFATSDSKIYAASHGISFSENLGDTWQKLGLGGLPDDEILINSIIEGTDGKIYVAPEDFGVFRLEGDQWKSVGTYLAPYNVLKLLNVGENLYAITQPSDVFKLD